MVYTYYDYLENYYESYYDYYYEYQYWPLYYGNYNGSNTTYNGTYPPSPYEYHAKYNMDVLTPPTLTVVGICALLSIFIAIITVYKICGSKWKNKATIGLTLFAILVHLAQNIIDPISYCFWYIDYDATSTIAMDIYMVWDITYVLAKVSLYVLFIYRYWLIFRATPAARTKEKYIIFGSFAAAMLTQCALYVVYILYGYVIKDEKNAERTYLNVCWAFLVIDTILICVLAFLLIRSVLKLVITIHKLNPDRKTTPFHLGSPTTTMTTYMEESIQTSQPTNESVSTTTQIAPSADMDESLPQPAKLEANITDSGISAFSGYQAYESGFMNRNEIISKESVADESGYLERPQITINDGGADIQISDLNLNLSECVSPSFDIEVQSPSERKRRETVASESVRQSVDTSKTESHKRKKTTSQKEKRLDNLLHAATRIAVTMLISMVSSFFYQFIWLLAMELEHDVMLFISFTWCIDATINMLCIYLSMSVAKRHYRCLCSNCCKFHQCILMCTEKIVERGAR